MQDLPHLEQEPDSHQETADRRSQVELVPAFVPPIGAYAAGHPHQTKNVLRHETNVETDVPEPESPFADFLVQLESEHFRPPVIQVGEISERDPTNEHLVEVGDKEVAIVELEVRRRDG